MAKIFLLITLLPLVELALLLTLSRYTSVSFTLAFVVLTGLAGALLLRYQGLQTFRNMRRDLSERRMPTDSLIDGAMILIAGVLLIAPGVLTDFVGISLLLPPCRRAYRRWITQWLKSRWHLQAYSSAGNVARSEVIDSYVVGRDEADRKKDENEPKLG